MDKITITGLKVSGIIGIHAWEKQIKQSIVFDIEIPKALNDLDDNIDNTIDYDKLCTSVTEFVENGSFNLIETLAVQVIELIKTNFPVDKITLTISKPNAIANASNISVTLNR